jgi:hypothetical protein
MGMQLIETVTVGSGGAASIEFTSIPQDGVDLLLVWSVRADTTASPVIMRFEFSGDTATNYKWLRLWGTGSAVQTSIDSNSPQILSGYATPSNSTTNTYSNNSAYISNYTSSSPTVSLDSVTENNATSAFQFIGAGSYNSAVTSILIRENVNSSILAGSTASLYKIS